MSLVPPATSAKWWSRSKSKDSATLRTNRSNSSLSEKAAMGSSSKAKESATSRFNTLVASAMGKTKKKLPIQDPPPPLPPVRPPRPPSLEQVPTTQAKPGVPPVQPPYRKPPHVDTRPTYTIRRYYDADEYSDPHTISEPRTPSDHPRDRSSYQNSVMTLSDPDPFASNGVMISPRIQDPNRLSVYSDASYPDSAKRNDLTFNHRTSYGSSSSNSHSLKSEGRHQRTPLPTPLHPPPPQTPRSAHDGNPQTIRLRSESSAKIDDVPRPISQTRTITRSRSILQNDSVSSRSTVMAIDWSKSNDAPPSASSSLAFPQPPSFRTRGMTVGSPTERPGTSNAVLNLASNGGLYFRRKPSELLPHTTPPSPASISPHSTVSVSRSRSSSAATGTQSPISGRPVVLVRKASAPRMIVAPRSAAPPPLSDLPQPPPPGIQIPPPHSELENFLDSLDDDSPVFETFPDRRSSKSSSIGFASPKMGLEDAGDAIKFLMRESFGHRDRKYSGEPGPSNAAKETNATSKKSSPPGSSSRSNILKKAVSQQNLFDQRHRHSGASFPESVGSGSVAGHDDLSSPLSSQNISGSKTPRKQRSFHHPRFPIPPLTSLRGSSSTSQSPAAPEHKKEQTQPRRRLFSGSSIRRNSSTQSPPPGSPKMSSEDDMRSLLSIDSISSPVKQTRSKAIIMSFSSFANHIALETENACIAPTWDEDLVANEITGRRESHQSDYAPQHILSPEALLKLEQEVERAAQLQRETSKHSDHAYERPPTPKLPLDAEDLGLPSPSRRSKASRSRVDSGRSDTSTHTGMSFATASEGQHHTGTSNLPLSPQRTTDVSGRLRVDDDDQYSSFLVRSTSVMGRAVGPKVPLSIRPSTAQPLGSTPSTPTTIDTITGSPQHPTTALPPPPRVRARLSHEDPEDERGSYKRNSIAPIHPLSPPPRQKCAKTVVIADDTSDRRSQYSSRPPSAFDTQRILQRRSIIKKPSFLEISDEEEDEDEDDNGSESVSDAREGGTPVSPIMEGSFLDLDRGDSFDSVRSEDNFVF